MPTTTKTTASKPAAAEPTTAEAPVEAPREPQVYPTLAAALAAFQAHLPTVRKGQTADVRGREGRASYQYDYADLTDVSEVVLPALAAVGLAWSTLPDTVDGNVVLRWELLHAQSNDHKSGVLPVGRAGSDWQSMGSALTYARRYALTAVTGVAPGGDDDDAAASVDAGARPAPVQKPVERPAPEYLPAGLYDLSTLVNRGDAEKMFYRARTAGHLNLTLAIDGQDIPFGAWLQEKGRALPAAEPVEGAVDVDPDAEAVAAHEAELADQAFVAGEKNG